MVKIVYGNSLDLVAVESIASFLNTSDIVINTKTDIGSAQNILNTLNEDLIIVGGENVCGVANLLVANGTILPAPINFCGGIIRLATVNGNRIFACTGGSGDIDILPICEFGPEPSRIGTLACVTEIMEKGLDTIWVIGSGLGYYEVSPDKVGDQFITIEVPYDVQYQSLINQSTGEISKQIKKAYALEGVDPDKILSFVTEKNGKVYAVVRVRGSPAPWLGMIFCAAAAVVGIGIIAVAAGVIGAVTLTAGAAILLGVAGVGIVMGSLWFMREFSDQIEHYGAINSLPPEMKLIYLVKEEELANESSITGGISSAIKYAGIGLVVVGGIYALSSMGIFGEKTKKSTKKATKKITTSAKKTGKKVVKKVTEYYKDGKKKTKVEKL